MAIVSISRIQIRRGRKNAGSGLPQLAGGELGWAVDTQELFIGNGAVSEGAPAVGNSKVLTEHDNLFELSDQYTYRNGSIQTGVEPATPIRRTLQERLDDTVSVKSFGATGDGTTDDTASLQRAIDQLFGSWSSSTDADNYKKRITLHIPAGLYSISNSLKIGPHVSIVGDGSGKTVISQSGAFPVIETVGAVTIAPQTSSDTYPRKINVKGMTLQSSADQTGLKIYSTQDSEFNDVEILGPYRIIQGVPNDPTLGYGIYFEDLSTPVNSRNNKFERIKIFGFPYAVKSDHDIQHNVFDNCVIEQCHWGVVFGEGTASLVSNATTGPINNIISNSRFLDINEQGLWIKEGYGNISDSNSFSSVGNDGGLEAKTPVHSVIKFEKNGNTSKHDYFTRTGALIEPIGAIPYIPEIEGYFKGELTYSVDLPAIGLLNSFETIIRLPAGKNYESKPAINPGVFDLFYHKTFEISYQTKMGSGNGMRQGTLTIIIDKENQTSHISDSYDHQGTDVDLLTFTAQLVDHDIDGDFETLEIKAKNPSSVPLTDVKIQIRSFS